MTCKKLNFGLGAVNVNFDLFKVFDFILGHTADVIGKLFNRLRLTKVAEVMANQVGIFFMFALKSAFFECLIYWNIVT